MTEAEHPADLLIAADRLDHEAARLNERAQAKRKEAALMRARAERLFTQVPSKRAPKFEPPDPLLAAAGIAAGDLGIFQPPDLGAALQIRKLERLRKIITALEGMGLITALEPDRETGALRYKAVDPDEIAFRDKLQELGEATRDQLADALEWPVQQLVHYIEVGEERGFLEVDGDVLAYCKPGPERIITRRRRGRQPERERPAYTEARATGEAVRVVNHGKRGKLGSQPGVRHRQKMKDAAYERQQAAKEARAAEQREKAKAQPAGPRARRTRAA